MATKIGPIDGELVEEIRLAIYRGLARTGLMPPLHYLIDIAGNVTQLSLAIEALTAQRHLALDSDGEIVLAHPFATRSFGFSAMSTDTIWWGGCAWDSFALPHLVDTADDVLIASRCPGCDVPMAWVVNRGRPPDGDEVAHFLTPVARMWDDVIHTCANQRLFCSNRCVDAWLNSTNQSEGYRMGLETLWRFAAHWYDGRLDRGYQRRDPGSAKDYFRSVGLSGPFWGL